jgi:hypothetical protein
LSEDLSGTNPRRIDGELFFTHRTAILVTRKLPGARGLSFSSRYQREDARVLEQRGLLCKRADFETGEESRDR